MSTRTRSIVLSLSAALVAMTAVAPLASAGEWRGMQAQHRDWRGGDRHLAEKKHEVADRHEHDDTAAWVGLGIAALAGAAIVASAAPEPVYAPPPAYPQPIYAAPALTCTTINGYAACIGPDGTWQYVR